MGFRFRKSIKVAPGIRINLGKKGASVSVGKRGANVTVGKTGVRTTVGAPGTGLSYTKHNAFKGKNRKNTSSPQTNSVISGGQGPNNQMDWDTALKIIKWTFYLFLGFIIFMMFMDSPVVLIGAAVIVTGMFLSKKKKQGSVKFKQTWLITTFGWLLTLGLWGSNIESVDDTTHSSETNPPNEMNTLISTSAEHEKEEPIEVEPAVTETIEPEKVSVEKPIDEVKEEVDLEETVSEPVSQPVTQPIAEREDFQNCTELRKVYPSGVASDHPAYQSKMDRDKDDWACES